MKQIPTPIIFLLSSVNRGLFLGICFGILTMPVCLAYDPAVDDPKLEELSKNFKAITSEYRDALKVKRDFIREEIKLKEDSIASQGNEVARKEMVVQLRDLKNQYDELSDEIRAINAGEVVKLSNTKDKVIAFLTQQ